MPFIDYGQSYKFDRDCEINVHHIFQQPFHSSGCGLINALFFCFFLICNSYERFSLWPSKILIKRYHWCNHLIVLVNIRSNYRIVEREHVKFNKFPFPIDLRKSLNRMLKRESIAIPFWIVLAIYKERELIEWKHVFYPKINRFLIVKMFGRKQKHWISWRQLFYVFRNGCNNGNADCASGNNAW